MKKKVSMKKKIIISIITLFVVTILTVGGYFLFSMLQPAAQIEDTDALYQTTLKETPKDGTTPLDYSIEDNIAYSLYKITITDEFYTVTNGEAVAVGVNQTVSNVRVVKNGRAMVTMITSGFIENAKQRYFMKDKVLLRDAVKPLISPTEANWSTEEPECVTYETIKKRYGWLPFDATGYIICEDTFINKDKMEMKDNGDGTYTLIFDLDPSAEKAPFWYRREVLTNSNSTIIPEFFSIHIEMTIDSEWTILRNEIRESYKVKSFGVEAVTDTHCIEEFFYDNVVFNKGAYDFFESFAYLQALDDTDDEEIKLDPLSIIVESLQKKDSSDCILDLDLDINGEKLNGVLALNISDLNNVKVMLKLDDIYVEYSDKLYLSLGNLKAYSSMDDLTSLIEKITNALPKKEGEGLSLDVNQILDDLGKASMEESDTNVIIDGNLNLAGINLPLHFEIDKNNNEYSLALAKTSIDFNGIKINASIKKS
ncbi:MAG: hypothetical protein K6B64_03185, partial [Acholeplasmatales bacterium]|nr:hypothetical protein [Acholeplasmatales bacterium]